MRKKSDKPCPLQQFGPSLYMCVRRRQNGSKNYPSRIIVGSYVVQIIIILDYIYHLKGSMEDTRNCHLLIVKIMTTKAKGTTTENTTNFIWENVRKHFCSGFSFTFGYHYQLV